MNNLRFQEFYRRRLPHIQTAGATYFVTFRLKNSLPREILEKLTQEAERIIKYVLYNPVKARLVKEQNDWKWAYCKHAM